MQECTVCLLNISEWPKFVQTHIRKWQNINNIVLRTYTGHLYVLNYESLLKDLKNELGRIFEFLNITVDATALECAVSNQEGAFHRAKKPVKLKTLYTAEMVGNITIAIDKVSDVLKSRFGMRLNYSIPED